jgi:hypothetical protein
MRKKGALLDRIPEHTFPLRFKALTWNIIRDKHKIKFNWLHTLTVIIFWDRINFQKTISTPSPTSPNGFPFSIFIITCTFREEIENCDLRDIACEHNDTHVPTRTTSQTCLRTRIEVVKPNNYCSAHPTSLCLTFFNKEDWTSTGLVRWMRREIYRLY